MQPCRWLFAVVYSYWSGKFCPAAFQPLPMLPHGLNLINLSLRLQMRLSSLVSISSTPSCTAALRVIVHPHLSYTNMHTHINMHASRQACTHSSLPLAHLWLPCPHTDSHTRTFALSPGFYSVKGLDVKPQFIPLKNRRDEGNRSRLLMPHMVQ